MANEPGNTGGGKPGGEAPAGQPAPAPAPSQAPNPTRGPFLIVTPPGAATRPPDKPVPQPAPPPVPAATPGPEATHEPERLVDPPPQRPAERPAPPRANPPSLSARSADRLAAMNPPPPRRRGGCLTFLLVIVIVAGGGFLLWREGKLDPLLTWAQPYTDKLAPITDRIRPIIAKIESLIPGHQEPAPEPVSDDAMVLETKQLLLKLDFQPGPMNGTLDPATIAAIEAYQDAAGLPVDGQPSQALLEDLRSVANPSAN